MSSYWSDYKTRDKLTEAWREFSRRKNKKREPRGWVGDHTKFFKMIRRGRRLKAMTPWEKMYRLLWRFKRFAQNAPKEEKLRRLKKMAGLRFRNDTPYEVRRKRKHSSNKICFCCKKNRSRYQHHIILLKNGGMDNGINRIAICEPCHEEIHDWLMVNRLESEIEKNRAYAWERFQ